MLALPFDAVNIVGVLSDAAAIVALPFDAANIVGGLPDTATIVALFGLFLQMIAWQFRLPPITEHDPAACSI
jgi:hypothetical protein